MDTRATHDQLHAVLSDLVDLLDQIPASMDDRPTPCHEYDIATLRQHVLGWLTAFTDGYASSDNCCSDPTSVVVDGTGADQVRALRDRLAQVLPRAADDPLVIGDSSMPGQLALSMMLWEYQVHGWDLARATDLPWDPDEDGVRESLAFAPGMLTPDHQGEGKTFGPQVTVDADASPLQHLVALSGRRPDWQAPPVESGGTSVETSGTFTVAEFVPQPHEELLSAGVPVGIARMRKLFNGAIEGESQTLFCSAFDPASETGTYVALDTFRGTVDGRYGGLVLAHSATTIAGGEMREAMMVIVPGSGTDALTGMSGTGAIVIDPDGTHHLRLNYRH